MIDKGWFKSEEHRVVFKRMLIKVEGGRDPEYLAALYVLASPLLASKNVHQYVKPGEIDFSKMFKAYGVWSSSQKSFAKLAAGLFSSSWKADINQVFYNLDADNVKIALEALRIRFLH